MSVYVKNGASRGNSSLCESCVNGHIERGYRENEEMIICEATYFGHRVYFRVRECSNYTERKRQRLCDMEEIAWILEPRGGKRVAGFVAPGEERKDAEEIELIITAPNNS